MFISTLISLFINIYLLYRYKHYLYNYNTGIILKIISEKQFDYISSMMCSFYIFYIAQTEIHVTIITHNTFVENGTLKK